MIKPEWGTKRQCPKCGTRFYDLTENDPVTCIECSHSWVPEPILKSKQALSFDAGKDKDKDEDKDDLETDDLDIDAEDDEPADDTSVDLGSDADDISEVVVEKREDDE